MATGIRKRHSSVCSSQSGGRCNCQPEGDPDIHGPPENPDTSDTDGHLMPGSHDEVRERMDAYLSAAAVHGECLTGDSRPLAPPPPRQTASIPHKQARKTKERPLRDALGYRGGEI